MLTVVQPSLRERHFYLLSKIFQTREGFYESVKDPFDTPRTIYIAYQNPKLGVFGSARLNSLVDSLALPFYQEAFSENKIGKSIEISLVSFRMEDHWAKEHTTIFDVAIRNFYRDLHQLVSDICEAQGFDEILSLSFEDDHPDLTSFGGWHFPKTHRFMKDSSSFVVGELPLRGCVRRPSFEGAA